jgi:type III secretion protein T
MLALEQIHRYLIALGYCMPRLLALFTILPLLSKEALPGLLRMGVVGSMAMLLVPGLAAQEFPPSSLFTLLGIIIKETIIGTALGLVIAIPLWAIEAMGDLADTQRGATIAQTLNPLTGHETSPRGRLYIEAIVTYLFEIGGFLTMMGAVYESFALWPVFAWWPGFEPGAAEAMLGLLDRLMYLAVLLGVPAIFAMFLAECGLAIVSRFAPQLQVFFLAMPIKSGLAMLVFAVYAVVLFDYSRDLLQDTMREANRTLAQIVRKGS